MHAGYGFPSAVRAARARSACTAVVAACAALVVATLPARAATPTAAATPSPQGAEGAPLSPPRPLPLAWCLERAAVANPDIAELAALLDAAGERIAQAGALEDVRFAYEASNVPTGTFDFDSTMMSGHQLGLRQQLPFPGLLASRERAAERGRDAAAFAVANRERTVASAVEVAWAELGYAQRALAITDRNLELLRQLASAAEAKYAVGSGMQADVLRAQVELTSLLEMRLAHEARVEAANARLVALLDLPPATALPPTASGDEPPPAPALAPLLARLASSSPLLEGLAAQVEQQRHAVDAAELEGLPDVDVGIGYRVRSSVPGDPVRGDDFLSAGVTVRLPVNRARWRAHAAEQRALLRAAEARLRSQTAAASARARDAHAALARADAALALLRTGLVPQAAQSFEASRSAYEVGRLDFTDVLESQMRLLDVEVRAERARADRHAGWAGLEAVVGADLR
ncbi:MAG: TolC family protein [Myxococcota bacterium]